MTGREGGQCSCASTFKTRYNSDMEAHESEVLKHIADGQRRIQDAIILLVQRYERAVYNFCFYTLKDASQAQEITTKTFIMIPGRLLAYELPNHKVGDLFVLLQKIAHELCIAQRPAMRFMEWNINEEERDWRGELSEQDRVVLFLRGQGLKWSQVGKILDISMKAAQKRGERAEERYAEIKNARNRTRNNG